MLDSLIFIIINLFIFSYIIHLEKIKCDCAKDWKQTTIKYLSVFNIIYNIILIIFFKNIVKYGIRNSLVINSLRLVNVVIIFYYISILLYFSQLKKDNCECSEDWKRKLLLFPLYIVILFILVLIVCKIKYNSFNLVKCMNNTKK